MSWDRTGLNKDAKKLLYLLKFNKVLVFLLKLIFMKTFGKALYMFLVIAFSMNIGWVIYYWNIHDNFSLLTFEVPKTIYLLIQVLALASFSKSLIDLFKTDNDKNEI